MSKKLFTAKAPRTQGALVTSMSDQLVTSGSARQAQSRGGDLVGGYPLNVRGGVASGVKTTKNGSKPKRKLMY